MLFRSADPGNFFWLGESALARLLLAEVQMALGKRAAAHDVVVRISTDVARLIASDASKIEWQIGLNGSTLALASQTQESNKAILVEALVTYVAMVRALVKDGRRLQRGQLLAAATAELQLARLLDQKGQQDEAAGHWRAVVESLAPFQQESNFHLLTLLARARLAQIGRAHV